MTFIKEVLPHEVEDAQKHHKRVVLIDVRSPEEYQEIHAPEAKLYPLYELNPEHIKNELDLTEDEEIYFICRSGGRSYKAAMMFAEAGFKRPINVKGGTLLWMQENLPIQIGA